MSFRPQSKNLQGLLEEWASCFLLPGSRFVTKACRILVFGRFLHWIAFRYDRPLHLKTRGRGVTFKKSSILSFFLSTWAISNSFESVDWCYPYKIAHPTLIEADMVGDQVCTQRHSAAKDRPRAQNTVTRRRAHHCSSPPECSVILLTAVHMDYCVQCRIICAFGISQHFFLLRSVVWVKLYEHITLRASTKLLYVPGFRIRPTTTTVCSSTPQQQCSAFSVNMILILCVLCKSFFYL